MQRASLSNIPYISLLLWGLPVTHSHSFNLFIEFILQREVSIYADRTLIVQLCSVLMILFCLAVRYLVPMIPLLYLGLDLLEQR